MATSHDVEPVIALFIDAYHKDPCGPSRDMHDMVHWGGVAHVTIGHVHSKRYAGGGLGRLPTVDPCGSH